MGPKSKTGSMQGGGKDGGSKGKKEKSSRPRETDLDGNISWQDIKTVQNLVERCLQQYMTQTEIITALQLHANVDPAFTCLIWQKLEEQNPDFFFTYHASIKLRDQVLAFNYLVSQQLYIMQKIAGNSGPSGNAPGEGREK